MNISSNSVPFFKPTIGQEEIAEVVDTLKSGWIGYGPKCQRFEQQFAQYIGSKHAIAVSSCTAALHLSLLALGIGSGDEVITSTMTFCSTVNAILYVGAKPVLVDVDPQTLNLDVDMALSRITQRTKAILPVHLYGQPVEMGPILEAAQSRGIYVVEDAAHAIEASYRGQKIGTLSDATAFSFYATKNMTTAEGGMVTTNNDELAEKIRVLRLHGLSLDAWRRYELGGYKHYQCIEMGFKYNMTDIQASIGMWQMKHLDEWRLKRKEMVSYYNELLAEQDIVAPILTVDDSINVQSYHLYPVMVNNALDRDDILNYLQASGVGVGVHFIPVHMHPYFRKVLGDLNLPVASDAGNRLLSLPLFPTMEPSDVEYVVERICQYSPKAKYRSR